VAIGQQDAAGVDKFATDPVTGLPRYFVGCWFRGLDAAQVEHSGASPASAAVEILAAGQADRAGVTVQPKAPDQANLLRLFLKAAGLASQAHLELAAAGAAFTVELAANGASARIEPSGDIVLKPPAAASVRVDGDLDVTGTLTVNGVRVP